MIVLKALTVGGLLVTSVAAQALVVPAGFRWDASTHELERLPAPTPTAVGTVPEPATWAMMVGGFGLIGLRHRRSRARSVAA